MIISTLHKNETITITINDKKIATIIVDEITKGNRVKLVIDAIDEATITHSDDKKES